MGLKIESPTDELTGRPLYFAPSDELPPLPRPGENYDRRIADYHHPIHTRVQFENLGFGGKAARDSGLQWVLRPQHEAFHRKYGGLDVSLYTTDDELFDLAWPGLAGYVPPKGIAFRAHHPREVYMGRDQIDRLRTSGQVMLGNNGERVRHFLLGHVLSRGYVNPKLVENFVYPRGIRKSSLDYRMSLADAILEQAVDSVLTQRMRDVYKQARLERLVREDVPVSLAGLVRKEIKAMSHNPNRFIQLVMNQCISLQPEEAIALPARQPKLRFAVAT